MVFRWTTTTKKKLFWKILLLIVDSDSDNFESLKKKKSSVSQQNGTSQKSRSSPGLKEAAESSIKSSSAHSKNGAKCPTAPVAPKTAAPAPQAKQTPTSVLNYFGNESIQRSGKKLVASTKRKAVSSWDILFGLVYCRYRG